MHRADHDRAGFLAERLEGLRGLFGMFDVTDGLGVGLWPEAFDLIECQIRTGGHDKLVISNGGSVGHLHPTFGRMNALGTLR